MQHALQVDRSIIIHRHCWTSTSRTQFSRFISIRDRTTRRPQTGQARPEEKEKDWTRRQWRPAGMMMMTMMMRCDEPWFLFCPAECRSRRRPLVFCIPARADALSVNPCLSFYFSLLNLARFSSLFFPPCSFFCSLFVLFIVFFHLDSGLLDLASRSFPIHPFSTRSLVQSPRLAWPWPTNGVYRPFSPFLNIPSHSRLRRSFQ